MINGFIHQFNNVPLQSICSTDISAFYSQFKGKSKSYICKYTQLIKAMFRSACEDGIILRSPVTKSVVIPDGFSGTHRALEQWERQLIVDSVGKHDYAVAAMLMLFAGLRQGEMVAFNIDRDVDFKKGVLHVREAVSYDGFTPVLTTTKTKAGVRTIPLFTPLRIALEGKHGLALPNTTGGYIGRASLEKKQKSYRAFLERQLNGGCYRLWYGRTSEHKELIASGKELPPWKEIHIRNHDYRHTFATMLWEANVDLKSAIKWMGHTNEKMMLQVYAHLTAKKEQESALAMAKAIESSFHYQDQE
jgi:integrase